MIKVISDPDQWNANISSRDRMDEVEQRLETLEHRVSGMSYLIKRIVMNKGLRDEDLQAIDDRMDDDTSVSGSNVTVGIISFIYRWWRRMLNRRSKPKTWTYTVYSEDTCRMDEMGGPYTISVSSDDDIT